jgi:DNA-binding response OmpR family regulator
MRLLLVEDEPSIADFVRQGLTEAGYAVDVAYDGIEGFDYILSANYDIFIFDIMLPKMDGIALLRKLRERGVKTPTLMLTAKGKVSERVAGLNAGADDYLVKPFAFPELIARITALLRRPPLQVGTVLQVGDLVMDIAGKKVTRNSQPIPLHAREYAVLEYFMRHPNQVLTRDQIGEHVWNFDFYHGSNVVDVYVGYLRRKIDKHHSQKLLHTIRGIGYCLSTEAR